MRATTNPMNVGGWSQPHGFGSAHPLQAAGHVSSGNFGNVSVGASGESFGSPHQPKYKPEVDQGGCHTKKNSIWRCWPQ